MHHMLKEIRFSGKGKNLSIDIVLNNNFVYHIFMSELDTMKKVNDMYLHILDKEYWVTREDMDLWLDMVLSYNQQVKMPVKPRKTPRKSFQE